MVVTKKKYSPPPFFRTLSLFILFFLTIFFAHRKFSKFEDVAGYRGGRMLLKKERSKELERKKKQLREEWVCYKLIASYDKYYSCPYCPTGYFWLYRGETAKYGITAKPSTRYTKEMLSQEGLVLIPIDTGSLTEMRVLELELIYGYPVTNENLKRPSFEKFRKQQDIDINTKVRYRLARPIQNKTDS